MKWKHFDGAEEGEVCEPANTDVFDDYSVHVCECLKMCICFTLLTCRTASFCWSLQAHPPKFCQSSILGNNILLTYTEEERPTTTKKGLRHITCVLLYVLLFSWINNYSCWYFTPWNHCSQKTNRVGTFKWIAKTNILLYSTSYMTPYFGQGTKSSFRSKVDTQVEELKNRKWTQSYCMCHVCVGSKRNSPAHDVGIVSLISHSPFSEFHPFYLAPSSFILSFFFI